MNVENTLWANTVVATGEFFVGLVNGTLNNTL